MINDQLQMNVQLLMKYKEIIILIYLFLIDPTYFFD